MDHNNPDDTYTTAESIIEPLQTTTARADGLKFCKQIGYTESVGE